MPTFISNLSVAKRLGPGFSLVLLLLALITIVVSISRLDSVVEATRNMVVPLKTERLNSDWYRNIHTGCWQDMLKKRRSSNAGCAFFSATLTYPRWG
ncbi:hypothetical protein [Curvibacter sp. PAE-UM]|uniref:hypothetical protein n=1 Tax=Curvibacter sp. PAE-UM TaxID=1714344 RepID=UPI00070DBE59|nr:hypothetical protein [Curvibacter sp. PAE-UM]KRI00664.1 hypothetical protein AO057_12415 [Curvibacter sp. PAE-UM]